MDTHFTKMHKIVNLHKSKVVQLDTLRKLLGVDDIKYASMRRIYKKCDLPSVEEVNDRADFIVKLDSIKQVKKLQF